jgi:hypothetical protein
MTTVVIRFTTFANGNNVGVLEVVSMADNYVKTAHRFTFANGRAMREAGEKLLAVAESIELHDKGL